jgi:YHS domain-containing protein
VVAALLCAAAAGSLWINAADALSGSQKPVAVAVDGYDLVSFFYTNGPAKPGDAKFAVVHGGKKYLFVSQTNADAFKSKPAAYLPQYGGHCAWAAAQGYVAPGYPQFATVVKGKLYFNYNAKVLTDWKKDILVFIAKSDRNWPSLASKAD